MTTMKDDIENNETIFPFHEMNITVILDGCQLKPGLSSVQGRSKHWHDGHEGCCGLAWPWGCSRGGLEQAKTALAECLFSANSAIWKTTEILDGCQPKPGLSRVDLIMDMTAMRAVVALRLVQKVKRTVQAKCLFNEVIWSWKWKKFYELWLATIDNE